MSIATLHPNTQCRKVTVTGGYSNNANKYSKVFERLVKFAMYNNLYEILQQRSRRSS
jgi:hypothetical protein